MDDKTELEIKIKDRLIGKKIVSVDLYLVNDKSFDIEDCDLQLVDGGIEFHLENAEKFAFGWDSEYELQNISFDGFDNLCTHTETLKLETKNDYYWGQFIGHTIENLSIHWTWFQDFDYNLFHVPDMMEFQMNMNKSVLIGAMDYDINGKKLENFRLDQEGWIIVFFDIEQIKKIKAENAHQ